MARRKKRHRSVLWRKGVYDPLWEGACIPIEHWHFHRRLWERYWIVLGPGEFGDIKRAVEKGRAFQIESHTEGKATYLFRLGQHGQDLVFALFRGSRPVTALPPTKALFSKHRKRLEERKARAAKAGDG